MNSILYTMNNIINEMIATGVATLTEKITFYETKIKESETGFIKKVLGEPTDNYPIEAHLKGLSTMRAMVAEMKSALAELQPKKSVKPVKRGRPRK